jgi:hypothetical protein
VDEPVELGPVGAVALELVTAGGVEVAGAVDVVATLAGGVDTTLTGFVVDGDTAAAVDALCPLGLEPAEAEVPVPMETPPGACARAPRLVGGASSFITIFVWTASTTPEALRL